MPKKYVYNLSLTCFCFVRKKEKKKNWGRVGKKCIYICNKHFFKKIGGDII